VDSKRLFLIDGMSHIYRAYYAIRGLSNSKGLPTNAIYGFTSMLRRLIEEQKPDYIGVAFDLEGPTVRHEKFESYKATRKPMPEDLAQQLPYIRRVCEIFRVPVITYQGYEADDVIGTLARQAVARGMTAMLVTSDKDMLQLVSDRVFVIDPMKENLVYDAGKVVEKMGVNPEQVPDLLGLWGDSVDNIPGAPGIGEKGAKELIRTLGTLEECLRSWDKVKKKTYQESLRDNAELIRMSRELATIRQDLPIELDLEALALRPPDRAAAFELFAELEFKSLMREFHEAPETRSPEAIWLEAPDALKFLQALVGQPAVYFAVGFHEARRAHRVARAVCLQGETGSAAAVDLQDEDVRRACDRVLSSPDSRKICWDAKLCLPALESLRIRTQPPVDDVMLMAFLTAPHIGDYSLRRWAMDQLHLSLPDEKTSRDLMAGLNRQAAAGVLARELECARRLEGLLRPRLNELNLGYVYEEIELPLIPVLIDMERTGIRVDPAKLKQLSSTMEKRLADVTTKIYAAAGTEFNINSPRQLGEVLFERLNLPTLKKTRKTGGYSTDQAVLEELAVSYEIPRLILEYRQVAKLKSTYVDALPSLISPETGRVHTSFNQTGTATGRLSSSDPNLQNIPVRSDLGRLIRGAFVPEDGNLLLSADYSQIELRVLAHLSGDAVLTEAFQHNEDIHERTAREVFGPAASANRAEYRRRAKVINFGIVYGLSAYGMAQRLGIPRDESQAIIDAYFARYKGVRDWLDRTLEEVRKTGTVQTLFGRIRPIPDIHSKDFTVRQFAERTAVNSPIQGTAADLIKLAMIKIHRLLKERNLAARLLLQVHDELVLELPPAEVDEVRTLLKHEMENAARLNVPLIVDSYVADNWMDMK
jgi:DNA polymerase-1